MVLVIIFAVVQPLTKLHLYFITVSLPPLLLGLLIYTQTLLSHIQGMYISLNCEVVYLWVVALSPFINHCQQQPGVKLDFHRRAFTFI